MTKEELIQFLKGSLRIGISTDGGEITVKLYLGTECISQDFSSPRIGSRPS